MIYKKNPKRFLNLQKKLGISSFTFSVRAYNLNLINFATYQSLKKDAEYEFGEFLKHEAEKKAKQKEKESKGGPNYFLTQLNRNSRLFTQTVLATFRGGGIEPSLASNLLNLQINKFQKLKAQLYK